MYCRCGCGDRSYLRHHGGHDFPLMSIDEEVKALEESKTDLEEHLANMNKRLEVLRKN